MFQEYERSATGPVTIGIQAAQDISGGGVLWKGCRALSASLIARGIVAQVALVGVVVPLNQFIVSSFPP